MIILACFGTLLFSLLLYTTRATRSWAKGIFPPSFKVTRDNINEAYISLGACLIKIDPVTLKEKTQYVNSYFRNYIRQSETNIRESFAISMKNQVTPISVTDWVIKHKISESERSKIIYFLAGMAMIDGSINRNEHTFLKMINSQLNLNSEHLEKIISAFRDDKKSKEKLRQPRNTQDVGSYYFQVLGLSNNATKVEIKKAYRTLVKIHHPDNFVNASPAQQKTTAEKFMEIQRAYDKLNDLST